VRFFSRFGKVVVVVSAVGVGVFGFSVELLAPHHRRPSSGPTSLLFRGGSRLCFRQILLLVVPLLIEVVLVQVCLIGSGTVTCPILVRVRRLSCL